MKKEELLKVLDEHDVLYAEATKEDLLKALKVIWEDGYVKGLSEGMDVKNNNQKS